MPNLKQQITDFARQKWPDLDLSQSNNRMYRAFSLEEMISFAEEFIKHKSKEDEK